jgi:hypothetical protein
MFQAGAHRKIFSTLFLSTASDLPLQGWAAGVRITKSSDLDFLLIDNFASGCRWQPEIGSVFLQIATTKS